MDGSQRKFSAEKKNKSDNNEKNLNKCLSLIAAREAVFSVTSKYSELGSFVDVVEPCYLHRTVDHKKCLLHFSFL